MNKMNFNAAESYEAPVVSVLDIQVEGVLCSSGNFGIKDWEPDGDGLEF